MSDAALAIRRGIGSIMLFMSLNRSQTPSDCVRSMVTLQQQPLAVRCSTRQRWAWRPGRVQPFTSLHSSTRGQGLPRIPQQVCFEILSCHPMLLRRSGSCMDSGANVCSVVHGVLCPIWRSVWSGCAAGVRLQPCSSAAAAVPSATSVGGTAATSAATPGARTQQQPVLSAGAAACEPGPGWRRADAARPTLTLMFV